MLPHSGVDRSNFASTISWLTCSGYIRGRLVISHVQNHLVGMRGLKMSTIDCWVKLNYVNIGTCRIVVEVKVILGLESVVCNLLILGCVRSLSRLIAVEFDAKLQYG